MALKTFYRALLCSEFLDERMARNPLNLERSRTEGWLLEFLRHACGTINWSQQRPLNIEEIVGKVLS